MVFSKRLLNLHLPRVSPGKDKNSTWSYSLLIDTCKYKRFFYLWRERTLEHTLMMETDAQACFSSHLLWFCDSVAIKYGSRMYISIHSMFSQKLLHIYIYVYKFNMCAIECIDITVKLQEKQEDELPSTSHTQYFVWHCFFVECFPFT